MTGSGGLWQPPGYTAILGLLVVRARREVRRDMSVSIDWVDRETLAYRSDRLTVLVWVDFEAGFFSRGRVVHTDSIKEWVDDSNSVVRPVSAEERNAITAAIKSHYAYEGLACTVVP